MGVIATALMAVLGFLFWGGLILGAIATIPWIAIPFLIFLAWSAFGRDPNRSPPQ